MCLASRVILSKQSAQSARGSVIQRSDHDQCSNHNSCQAEYVHGFVNTNIAVVALWHRNGPISTTETRANRCPNGNGNAAVARSLACRRHRRGPGPTARPAGAPSRRSARQRGNHQGTPSAHPDFARNSQTRAGEYRQPLRPSWLRVALPNQLDVGHFITHYEQVDDSVPPPSAPESGPVNPSHCLPREQPRRR